MSDCPGDGLTEGDSDGLTLELAEEEAEADSEELPDELGE